MTRGCPFACTFCAGKSITGHKLRKRSCNNTIEEIKYLIKDFGVHEFMVEDENFTFHKDLTMEFCNEIIKQNIKINWSCPSGVRLDTLDLEILILMKKSGCHSLSVGVEFGTQRMLDLTKKHLKLDTVKEKIKLIRDAGIKTTGFFMMGMPTETEQEMKQTSRFANQLDIDRAQFNNFMPLPGSQLYEDLKQNHDLSPEQTKHYFVHDVGYTPDGISRAKLKNLQRLAYLAFYSRPKILWNALKEVKNPMHLKKLFSRFCDAMA